MPKTTETENFIKSLAELRDAECGRRKTELRLHIRTQAQRFVEEFRVGFQDRQPSPASMRHADQASRPDRNQIRSD